MIYTTINITTPLETRLYGVALGGSDWEQSNTPTNLALLDKLATVAGTYSGTVYEDTDELYAPDTDATLSVEFLPNTIEVETGTISGLISDVSVTGEGINTFDIDRIDNSKLKDNIMQLYRR